MLKNLERDYKSWFIITTIFLSVFVSSELSLVNNNTHGLDAAAQSVTQTAQQNNHRAQVDITDPSTHDKTVFQRSIIIKGSASDTSGSGIKKVEAYVKKLPFNGTVDYKITTPLAKGNWSSWSFPVTLNETGSYIIKARVTNNIGEENWADVTLHLPAHVYDKKIAFVEPTFTYAAYRSGSFYDFYGKYSFKEAWNANKTLTTDVNLLRNRPIPHGPFPYFAHPQTLDIPYIDYFKLLLQHVKQDAPYVKNLTDVDVHSGKIFQPDGRNAFDVLFLFHNEYATAAEYNNLRQFVSNGGTIVFTEGNLLYAEVSYNKTNDSITLVKGHNWIFDGKGATRSVAERWLNENKDWMGSNFFNVPSSVEVHFRNNPFNYTHTEEQYVTNPKARILINYETSYSSEKYPKPIIASYYMNYGKGRVINLGIWGHMLVNNKAFLNYFDNTIMPLALGPPITFTEKQISSSSSPSVTNNANTSMPNIRVITLPTIMAEASDPSGTPVDYPVPSISNNTSSQSPVVCAPPPGSVFPIGDSKVKCTLKDNNNNTVEIATFTVRVTGTPQPPPNAFFFNPGG